MKEYTVITRTRVYRVKAKSEAHLKKALRQANIVAIGIAEDE
jgi:hypothetical protein